MRARKIDLIPPLWIAHNLSLTGQNIVVAFQINRKLPEGRGSEEGKIVYIYLLFKEN